MCTCISWSLTSYYHGPMFVYKHCYFALYILPSHMLVVCVCVCVYVCMYTCMRACMCVCVSCTCVGVGILYIYMHALVVTTIPHCYTVTFTTHMMCSYIYICTSCYPMPQHVWKCVDVAAWTATMLTKAQALSLITFGHRWWKQITRRKQRDA